MQKITPHLWFDTAAMEAAELYVSAFGKPSVATHVGTMDNTPSGPVDIVSFTLWGASFMAISAGPAFTFNPSISFQVQCQTPADVDALWQTLSERGTVLMPLQAYPFSEHFGWVQDRFGLSWQLMSVGERERPHPIAPVLLFTGAAAGRAEEAMHAYVSIFPDSHVDDTMRHGADEAPEVPGTVQYARFTLAGQPFRAIDSAREHGFSFNEAISLVVHCDTQDEIDYYWGKLSAVPQAEQCGWLKDTFGVSWQIFPTVMAEMMRTGRPDQIARVTKAFLQMKKFDLAALDAAFG